MSLSLGNPQHRTALGALEEAIEILLPFPLSSAGDHIRDRTGHVKKCRIFPVAAGTVPAEDPEVGSDQAEKCQQPQDRTCNTPRKHGNDQKDTGKKAGEHTQFVMSMTPIHKSVSSAHRSHLPFSMV